MLFDAGNKHQPNKPPSTFPIPPKMPLLSGLGVVVVGWLVVGWLLLVVIGLLPLWSSLSAFQVEVEGHVVT